ncbi:hypothetical protein CMV52_14365 [Klebsiella pneumoniae]|nr:hypothetical protein CMV62_16735 [Klebsiella pneumoniae]RJK71506.1 hypothetical protein CMV52_14365 [Klebsiella pneumoniae]RJK78154.1 hypothetical protein CMV53_10350 [Klebsiella pneumoniae]RJK79656.1 hypothetical protein CMV56_11830 [Klebsiella pneumoniae]
MNVKSQPTPDQEIKIEVIRWHQKLQEITYIEAGQHMRALNQLMWQIPSLVIAINGGLWYASTLVNEASLWMIFGFLTIFDLLTICTLFRLRALIGKKITKQNDIEDSTKNSILQDLSHRSGIITSPTPAPKKELKYIVVGCWTICLLLCALINMHGFLNPSTFSKSNKNNKSEQETINSPSISKTKSTNGEIK